MASCTRPLMSNEVQPQNIHGMHQMSCCKTQDHAGPFSNIQDPQKLPCKALVKRVLLAARHSFC